MYNQYALEEIARQHREELLRDANQRRLLKGSKTPRRRFSFSLSRLLQGAARSFQPQAKPQPIPCT